MYPIFPKDSFKALFILSGKDFSPVFIICTSESISEYVNSYKKLLINTFLAESEISALESEPMIKKSEYNMTTKEIIAVFLGSSFIGAFVEGLFNWFRVRSSEKKSREI